MGALVVASNAHQGDDKHTSGADQEGPHAQVFNEEWHKGCQAQAPDDNVDSAQDSGGVVAPAEEDSKEVEHSERIEARLDDSIVEEEGVHRDFNDSHQGVECSAEGKEYEDGNLLHSVQCKQAKEHCSKEKEAAPSG